MAPTPNQRNRPPPIIISRPISRRGSRGGSSSSSSSIRRGGRAISLEMAVVEHAVACPPVEIIVAALSENLELTLQHLKPLLAPLPILVSIKTVAGKLSAAPPVGLHHPLALGLNQVDGGLALADSSEMVDG